MATTTTTTITTTTIEATFISCWQLVNIDIFHLSLTIMLVLVDLLVIFGNFLVIIAVLSSRSLHSTTNFLIMSLAISDFLLGVFVLPWSISQELLVQIWPFQSTLCQIWLALDVWLCTASIYSLLAISFDRFMAVTQPIRYKFISSTRTAGLLVAVAWLVSFFICLPPLVVPLVIDRLAKNSTTLANSVDDTVQLRRRSCQCSPMNNTDMYVIYSALGSFVIPMFVIVGLNVGIYVTVVRSGLISDYVSVGGRKPLRKTTDFETVQLRIHRGRTESPNDDHHRSSPPKTNNRLSISFIKHLSRSPVARSKFRPRKSTSAKQIGDNLPFRNLPSPLFYTDPLEGNRRKTMIRDSCHQLSTSSRKSSRKRTERAERQVAKTVGIVVGCFIACWLPFFVVYILQAYDMCIVGTCVPSWLFSLAFWLGYSNSAFNPIIYSLFSREFRRAFRRVLVRITRFSFRKLPHFNNCKTA